MEQRAYVFLCSNYTEAECLEKMLLGGMDKYEAKTPGLSEGDFLFLYNYDSNMLRGVFKAVGDPAHNIDPNAWKKSGAKFPWQVRIEYLKEFEPLSKRDLQNTLPLFRKYPRAQIAPEYLKPLLNRFEKAERLPNRNTDCPYEADDGHMCASKGELEIDNWLYHNNIVHAYEPALSILGVKRCDFFIPDGESIEDGVFIEFWGLNDKKYLKDKEEKVALYREKKLNLVEVEPRDLKNIDDSLYQKLAQYLELNRK